MNFSDVMAQLPDSLAVSVTHIGEGQTPGSFWLRFHTSSSFDSRSVLARMGRTPFVVTHLKAAGDSIDALIRPRQNRSAEAYQWLCDGGLDPIEVEVRDDSFTLMEGTEVYRAKFRTEVEWTNKTEAEAMRAAVQTTLGDRGTVVLATLGADDGGTRSIRVLFTLKAVEHV